MTMTPPAAATPRRRLFFRQKPTLGDRLVLTAIIAVSVTAAFPLAWMVLTSLKTPAGPSSTRRSSPPSPPRASC
jgi:ABC-type glycerol-3-phosphate transport system permease component